MTPEQAITEVFDAVAHGEAWRVERAVEDAVDTAVRRCGALARGQSQAAFEAIESEFFWSFVQDDTDDTERDQARRRFDDAGPVELSWLMRDPLFPELLFGERGSPEERERAQLLWLGVVFRGFRVASLRGRIRGVGSAALKALVGLFVLSEPGQIVVASHGEIARTTASSARTIRRGLKVLSDRGLISRRRRGLGRPNSYLLLLVQGLNSLDDLIVQEIERCMAGLGSAVRPEPECDAGRDDPAAADPPAGKRR